MMWLKCEFCLVIMASLLYVRNFKKSATAFSGATVHLFATESEGWGESFHHYCTFLDIWGNYHALFLRGESMTLEGYIFFQSFARY